MPWLQGTQPVGVNHKWSLDGILLSGETSHPSGNVKLLGDAEDHRLSPACYFTGLFKRS
jgi:hypothetical protein